MGILLVGALVCVTELGRPALVVGSEGAAVVLVVGDVLDGCALVVVGCAGSTGRGATVCVTITSLVVVTSVVSGVES